MLGWTANAVGSKATTSKVSSWFDSSAAVTGPGRMPVAKFGTDTTPWSSSEVVDDGTVNSGASLTGRMMIEKVALGPMLSLGNGPGRPLSTKLTMITAVPFWFGAVTKVKSPVGEMLGWVLKSPVLELNVTLNVSVWDASSIAVAGPGRTLVANPTTRVGETPVIDSLSSRIETRVVGIVY